MPPVAKTSMRTWCAIHIVVATVVALSSFCATTMGRSRLTLRTFCAVARCDLAVVQPGDQLKPAMMPTVRGCAWLRTTASMSRASARLCG